MRGMNKAVVAVALGALIVAACSGDDDDGGADKASGSATTEAAAPEAPELPDDYAGYQSATYADDAHWVCLPGRDDDPCSRDLDATAVYADGHTKVVRHEAAENPPIDCFYVYPTVSTDQTPNSDFEAAETEEISAVVNQAARLDSTCRVYAPIYRQVTLSMIGGPRPANGEDPGSVAYNDVVDAFRQYMANDNDGRGVVLIGHSQGANHLSRLISEEIDDEPALRSRLVSALLLGWPVTVPEGGVVGGSFDNIPLCEATDQTGCVVAYSSFRSTAPPPAGSLFGRPIGGDGQAACVNPASPGGGSAVLQPYFLTEQPGGALIGGIGSIQPFADAAQATEITTPWMTFPDLIEAECVHDGGFTYLALNVHGDPSDPRTDDIIGDLTPQWGMHLVDANVAMGDLEDLVAAEADAYTHRT